MAWEQKLCVEDRVEKALFFGESGRRKYAVIHEPSEAVAPQDPILVCHPHFEEKLWAHRVLVGFSREAADRGHPVLRFDLSGQGDSEGEIEQFDFEDLEADVDEALALLQQQFPGRPFLAGLRLGGTLAGRCASRNGASAVLWEPVLDPMTWVQEVLRTNLAFQLRHHGTVLKKRDDLIRDLRNGGTVQIEGYGLTADFFSKLMQSEGLLGPGFPGGCREVLGITIRKRRSKNGSPLERAVGGWNGTLKAVHAHIQDEPFWGQCPRYREVSEELFHRTLDWMEGVSRGRDS